MKKEDAFIIIGLIILTIIAYSFDHQIVSSISRPFAGYISLILSSWLFIFFVFVVAPAAILIRRQFYKEPAAILLAFIFSIAISLGIKILVARERPLGSEDVMPFINLPDYSFTSNHASAIGGALYMIKEYLGEYFKVFVIAGLVCVLSRVMLLEHYLSDVFGGLLVGVIAGIIIFSLFRGFVEKKIIFKNKDFF